MKSVLSIAQYTITFGPVGSTKIDLNNTGVSRAAKHCMAVINQTRNQILYSQGSQEYAPYYASPPDGNSSEIYFNIDTSSPIDMSGDSFTVVFDWPTGVTNSFGSHPVVVAADSSLVTDTTSISSSANSTAGATAILSTTAYQNNAAFSRTVAVGGQMDDTSTTVATENNVSAARITAQRAFHTNLRNASGTEIGTSTTPLSVGLDSVISTANSSTATLGSGGVFTGTSEDVSNYAEARVSIFSDRDSATDGLSIQQSSNGTNWDFTNVFTYSANNGSVFSFGIEARYFRIVYTNSASAQGSFRLYTVFHRTATKPSSQRPGDARSNQIDMEENLAYLMGYNGSTWDRLRTTGTGILSVSPSITMPTVTTTNVVALNGDLIASTDVSAYRDVLLQVTGTWTATVQFQYSNDNSNFINGFAYNVGAQTYVASFTGNGLFRIPVQGKYLRVRATSFTSGTIAGTAFGEAENRSNIPPTSQAVTISSGTVTTVSTVTTCSTVSAVTTVNNNLAGQTSAADIASSAIAATANSGTFTQGNYNAAYFVLGVTVVSGTNPTFDAAIQESADGGTNWFDVYHFPRITATGVYTTPIMSFSGNRYRLAQTIGGTTPSFTRSLTTQRVSSVSYEKIRSFFNRTIDPNTLNSTTSSFYVEGLSSLQFVASMNAGAAVDPVFSLEGSDDNSNWYDLGCNVTATLSTTKFNKVADIATKFVRVRTSTAGTTASLNYISIRGHE